MSSFPLVEFGLPTAGTTAQRPANASVGHRFFDATIGQLMVWNGTDWQTCGGGTGGATAVAAAGSSQTNAAQLVAGLNNVTGANGTKGVILPIAAPGLPVEVFNASSSSLLLYPATSGTINDGSANASITIAANTYARFVGTSTTNWGGIYAAGGTYATLTGTETLTNKTLTTPVINGGTGTSLAMTGAITSSGGGVGYATGAGGTVSQLTNRSTGVTLNTLTGQITGQGSSLAAGAEAIFVVTNSAVGLNDVVVLSVQSGPTADTSVFSVSTVTAGSFSIKAHNLNASTADTGAPIINFAVIKGAAS